MFQLLLITGQRGNLVHCTVKQSNTSQHVRNGACATWAKPSTYELCACATERKTNIINNYPQHMRSAHTPRGRHVSKTRTIYAREIRTYHVVGKWAKPEPSIHEQYARTTWSASEQNQNHLYKSNTHVPRGRKVSKTTTIYTRVTRTYHVVGTWAIQILSQHHGVDQPNTPANRYNIYKRKILFTWWFVVQ